MIITIKEEKNSKEIPTLNLPTEKAIIRKIIVGDDGLTYEEEIEIEIPIFPDLTMPQK